MIARRLTPALAAGLAVLSLCSACTTAARREAPPRRHDAQAFYSTTSHVGASFAPDESRILVTSDRDGVFNVYSLPVAGGEPEQLTFSKASANFGLAYFPADERVLFAADQGGNEITHLFVRELDGTVVELTPEPDARATFAGFSFDDRTLYVTTNQRDPRFMDLYAVAIPEARASGPSGDYERSLLFENAAGYNLGPVSRDGRFLAVARANDNSDSDVYLVDLADPGAAPRHVTPHAGSVAHVPETFAPDGALLYYRSNEGSEFERIWSYALDGGARRVVYDADWDVSSYAFSRSGAHLAVAVNEDARSRVRAFETASGRELDLSQLPAGEISGITFPRSGRSLACYVNRDTSPADLYVLSLEGGGLRRLTRSLNPAIAEEDLVDSEVVRFRSFDGLEIPAILYRPRGTPASQRAAAVIYVHGGPGGQTRVGYNPTIQHLVNHGYVVLGINNRGSSGYGKTFHHLDDRRHGQDDLDDCVFARRYLAGLDWVDGDRVAIMGGSYGGYMVAAALAFRPDEFRAGIDIFGVTNWLRTLESIPPWWEAQKKSLYAEMGDPATDRERLHAISPLFHAERIRRPLLVVQGKNDPRVLQVESDELVEKVRAAGVPVEYVLFDDEGHGFRRKENRIRASEAYLDFLDAHVGWGMQTGREAEPALAR